MIAAAMTTAEPVHQSPRQGRLTLFFAALGDLGILRQLLLGMVIVVVFAAPFADGTVHMHDWRLLPSVVAPSVMMMLVFAVPLDMTMTRIFMLDASGDERRRLRRILRIEAIAYAVLLASWTPFLLGVLDLSPFG